MEAKPIKVPNLKNIVLKVKSFDYKAWFSDFRHQVILAVIYACILSVVTGIYAFNWYKSITVEDYVQTAQNLQAIKEETAEYVENALETMPFENSQAMVEDNLKVGRHTISTNISSIEGGYLDCKELESGVYLIYYYKVVDDLPVISAMVSVGKNLTALFSYIEEPVEGTRDVWMIDFSQGEITFDIS